uniref:Uncharacterized protein n=1 Tax=Zooxanthella nutricula TaxID=1333877 RepID=A0A7S2P6A7_9DINO
MCHANALTPLGAQMRGKGGHKGGARDVKSQTDALSPSFAVCFHAFLFLPFFHCLTVNEHSPMARHVQSYLFLATKAQDGVLRVRVCKIGFKGLFALWAMV